MLSILCVLLFLTTPRNPASYAGDLSGTSRINKPFSIIGMPLFSDSNTEGFRSIYDIPKIAFLTKPVSIISVIDFKAFAIGIVNPMPAETPAPRDAVFIPSNSPLLFSRGPPLFPGFIAASVCKTLYILRPVGAVISLLVAEIIPAVNVWS